MRPLLYILLKEKVLFFLYALLVLAYTLEVTDDDFVLPKATRTNVKGKKGKGTISLLVYMCMCYSYLYFHALEVTDDDIVLTRAPPTHTGLRGKSKGTCINSNLI